MKLKDLGEFQLIDRIRQQTAGGADVHRGIGDDAAVLALPESHHLLTSTDMLIEDVHFRRDWISPEELGHKAVAVNLSDLAAMGGTPRYLYLGFACPDTTDVEEINAFIKGALAEARRFHVTLVGGDTCRSPGPWIIAVTVEGSVAKGQDIGRDGGRPGDLIMVSGTLGDSALALALLEQKRQPDQRLLTRHCRPTPRVELGCQLGKHQLASAMIDISDGLAGDLEHILQASCLDGLIEEAALPLSEAFQDHVRQQPVLRELALFGGEDYELLFTTAPENEAAVMSLGDALGLLTTRIGTVKKGSGNLALRDRAGIVQPLLVRGYDHFCRP